jgi:dihydroorotate dehydrogenase electron transfer subunit
MKQFFSKVINVEELGDDVIKLTITNNEKINFKPGQFLNIKPQKFEYPFLRRPISLHYYDGEKIELLIKVLGEGTKNMRKLVSGDIIDCIAPLGNGFELVKDKRVLIVGGGIGTAPMTLLANELNEHNEVKVFYGFKNEFYGIERMVPQIVTVSEMTQGRFVTQDLEDELKKGFENTIIYACGPTPMLKKIQQISNDYNVEAYISLEAKMACGIGACIGCTVRIKSGNFDYLNMKVCVDGPVFISKDVIFDE